MVKRLLLLSNSTNYGEGYLQWPIQDIKTFLGKEIKNILFIPYAGVTISWEEYEERVARPLLKIGYQLESIHRTSNPVEAVKKASAIAVGGGNTFRLLQLLYKNNLINAIRERVNNGVPYIGWSAGSNVACPTICTTNDMPVVQPPTFEALNLLPFQINAHYTDAHIPNHGGETRSLRLEEFLILNPEKTVVALPESTLLKLEDNCVKLKGSRNVKVFRKNQPIKEYSANHDLNFLLNI